jgi:hypothetical protein
MNKNRETLMKFISEQNQKIQNDISKQGYKDNSPYRNNPFNIIQGTAQGTPITMDGVSQRLYVTDGKTSKVLEPNSGTHFFSGPQVTEVALAKYGGLLNKTVKCSNCGWSWKAADGGNDVATCHKCGAEVNGLLKAQMGGAGMMYADRNYQTAGQVKYGTPEYTEAYNRGEVITDKGVRSPIALDEVVIQNNYKRPRGFWEQSIDKYVKDNKDAGLFGALGSVVTYPLSVGQHALTYATTGKVQDPDEAWGYNTDEGWFDSLGAFGRNLVDASLNLGADPSNLFGAGILTKGNAISKLGKIRNIKTSAVPELTEELSQQGFTWSMNPLGKVFGEKLPEGWHRKMGSAKGIQSVIDNQGIVSPSNDHLFFAYGKKPNENYAGVFNTVVDKSKLADSEISGFSTFYGPRGKHQGVSPVTSKGKSMTNIPITDPALSIHRRLPFTNSYIPIPKEAITSGPRTLKETLLVDPTLANFQKYGEDATKIALWLSAAQQAGHMGAGSNDKDKYPLGVPVLQRAYEASKAYVQPQLEKTADEFQKLLNSTQYKNGGFTKYQTAGEVKDETYVIPESELQEVVVEPSEFSKYRIAQKKAKSWEEFANERYLGNFEKNMGQTINNLPAYRKQEYEDYIDKLAFDEYVKTHPALKGENRGAYINRLESENANTPSFQRAYEANAPYNDATDINKWRKFLIGLGSVVVPKPAMDYMKQKSDYFSAKEKQAMIDNPISTQVGDVLGALEPFTIPVETLNSEKSFGQIASGESADIPMSARLLGDPLMPLFEAAPLIGAGFKTVGRALGTEEGLLSNAYKLNSNAERLNDANKSYRLAGMNAFEDFKNTGVLRSKTTLPENATFLDRVDARTTSFPSFQKGYADMAYAKPEGSVVFETALPTFRRGEINPVTGLRVKGRHYAHRVIDPTTGKTMTEIPAADIRVFKDKPHWWKGYQQIEVPALTTEESAIAKLGALRETSAPVQNIVQEAAVVKPWQMEELPGLHIKSTMANNPKGLHTQVAKDGTINTENALKFIKNNEGEDKYNFALEALGENIPKKMDYNDFTKTIQDKIITLDVQINPNANSSYGVSSLGYELAKKDSLETAIINQKNKIEELKNEILINKKLGQNTNDLENKLNSFNQVLQERIKQTQNIPLENKTVTFSNKTKFGKGSSAHDNPDETLGHIHYLIDSETPDIITATQLQSDALQGTHRIMPKTFDPEKAKYTVQRMAEIQEKNIATLNKMKAEGAADYEIKQMQEIVDAQELQNVLQKGHVENFAQKSLLDKDHQSRFLQEFVNYAAQKGGINKVRLPTSETAAKVQSYMSISNNSIGPNTKKLLDNSSSFDEFLKAKYDEVDGYDFNKEELKSLEKIFNDYKSGALKPTYEPQHQTILKKYSEQPKLIKKLFGEEPKIVTDSKGNTWYEFDIPESFKQGKGQIKAFKQGGTIGKQKKALGWVNS